MPQAVAGNTKFDFDPSFTGKIKISNEEGNSLAIPAEDLLRFVAYCFVVPERERQAQKKDWRDVLTGG